MRKTLVAAALALSLAPSAGAAPRAPLAVSGVPGAKTFGPVPVRWGSHLREYFKTVDVSGKPPFVAALQGLDLASPRGLVAAAPILKALSDQGFTLEKFEAYPRLQAKLLSAAIDEALAQVDAKTRLLQLIAFDHGTRSADLETAVSGLRDLKDVFGLYLDEARRVDIERSFVEASQRLLSMRTGQVGQSLQEILREIEDHRGRLEDSSDRTVRGEALSAKFAEQDVRWFVDQMRAAADEAKRGEFARLIAGTALNGGGEAASRQAARALVMELIGRDGSHAHSYALMTVLERFGSATDYEAVQKIVLDGMMLDVRRAGARHSSGPFRYLEKGLASVVKVASTAQPGARRFVIEQIARVLEGDARYDALYAKALQDARAAIEKGVVRGEPVPAPERRDGSILASAGLSVAAFAIAGYASGGLALGFALLACLVSLILAPAGRDQLGYVPPALGRWALLGMGVGALLGGLVGGAAAAMPVAWALSLVVLFGTSVFWHFRAGRS